MPASAAHDSWSAGAHYERYMGRWSRKLAVRFLDWLAPRRDADWLELGCGTGALSAAILSRSSPNSLTITDHSEDFLRHTRNVISDARAHFEVADAQSLRHESGSFDFVASALALNFVPDKKAALREMHRVLKPGGVMAFYVWDYPGGGMGFIDAFWKAAIAIDRQAATLDEGVRFPFCTPIGLESLCADTGIAGVTVSSIQIETAFEDFEALWLPFTLGAGPAPGYCKSLDDHGVRKLRSKLKDIVGDTSPIKLPARAWAVRADKVG